MQITYPQLLHTYPHLTVLIRLAIVHILALRLELVLFLAEITGGRAYFQTALWFTETTQVVTPVKVAQQMMIDNQIGETTLVNNFRQIFYGPINIRLFIMGPEKIGGWTVNKERVWTLVENEIESGAIQRPLHIRCEKEPLIIFDQGLNNITELMREPVQHRLRKNDVCLAKIEGLAVSDVY